MSGRWIRLRQVDMKWTPKKVTLLRVAVGFAAVCLFGRGAWANLAAVALTVTTIALDALDGHIARKRKMATPIGAQLDILGDRMIENVYFTYFAVMGMVSLWLPVLVEGWKYIAGNVGPIRGAKSAPHISIREAKSAAQEAM